ncbi:MAG: type II secretion system protein [Campylobacterota bacterium]|nr:type II secretion system protein [Campylobacterota bacterium]
MKCPVDTMRSAFTMLEAIFAIVILGIVASIGSEIIADVYERYIVQRAIYRSSLKTELAAQQIANRLTYAIPGTVIGRKSDGTYLALEEIPDDTYVTLQWIGADEESFSAITSSTDRLPGWSGLCDLNASSLNSLSTPGSNLGLANTIIGNLSGSTKNITNAAVFFPGTFTAYTTGYSGPGTSTVSTVASGTGSTMTLDAAASRTMKEHYKLAWTSYAIVPIQRGSLFDLELQYNFQPWDGNDYNKHGNGGPYLIKNVSVFRIKGTGNTIRFKLCQQENIGEDYNITTCKEKAVIR